MGTGEFQTWAPGLRFWHFCGANRMQIKVIWVVQRVILKIGQSVLQRSSVCMGCFLALFEAFFKKCTLPDLLWIWWSKTEAHTTSQWGTCSDLSARLHTSRLAGEYHKHQAVGFLPCSAWPFTAAVLSRAGFWALPSPRGPAQGCW